MSKRAAVSAGVWSGIDILFRQGVLFVVSLILARLLEPTDFGIIALLTFFTTLSQAFVQGGLSAALVQRQTTSVEEESAIFWWNLLASALFAAALIAAGPWLAGFYGYPVLRPLTLVAGLFIVASALGAIQTALLTRGLEFRRLTAAGIVSSLVGGAVGVIGAWQGLGVWALAWQLAANGIVNSLMLWLLSRWRPVVHTRLSTVRHLLGFGGWISLATVLEVLYTQGFSLIVGKLYGARELGLYNRAVGTQLLPTSIISSIIGRICLPLFASRAEDPAALRRGLRLAIAFSMLLNLPAMAGLAVLAPDIILVLFGAKWMPAAPILTLLAVAGMLYPVHVINLQMVLAQGQPKVFIRNEIAKKTIGVACVVAGSLFGIVGLAASQIVYNLVAFVLNAQPARRSLGYGPLRQLGDLKGILFATAAMAAVLLLLRHLAPLSPAAALVLLVPAGAVTFVAVGWLIRSTAFLEALQLALDLPLARRLLRRGPVSGL